MNSTVGMSKHFYKFMNNISRDHLKSDAIKSDVDKPDKAPNESNDEWESQATSHSAILIHKRYNQSANDKQMTQIIYDPNTISTDKAKPAITKELEKTTEKIEKPQRHRMLYSIVYKRHNPNFKSKDVSKDNASQNSYKK